MVRAHAQNYHQQHTHHQIIARDAIHQSITCGTIIIHITSETNTRCATYTTLTNDITLSITSNTLTVGITRDGNTCCITCSTLTIGITSDPNTQYITYGTLIVSITRDTDRTCGPTGQQRRPPGPQPNTRQRQPTRGPTPRISNYVNPKL